MEFNWMNDRGNEEEREREIEKNEKYFYANETKCKTADNKYMTVNH